MTTLVLLAVTVFQTTSFVKASEISLSFDDAPKRGGALYTGVERTNRLIKVMNKYQVQAVFYLNPAMFSKDDGFMRIRKYDRAGHIIANHTHTHPDLNKVETGEYIVNIEKAHGNLVQFKNFKPWFRYPYLRHGDTELKRDRVRSYLASKNYKIGYVTIDTQDWFMASLVDKHLKAGGAIDEKKLCHAFSEMIWDSIVHFDEGAQKYLNKKISHSLLLHENDLVALCLEDLILKIQSNEWKIVSPNQTMEDPIYSLKPSTFYTNNGLLAALVYEKTKVKIRDPWSEGNHIKSEFTRRRVFK